MCIIIAEAGENHLGSVEIAKKLIDLAKDSSADYVKFQYYNAEECAENDPERKWFQRVQLDKEKIRQLYNYSNKKGINFLCTPWDSDKADDLFRLGIKDMKIASFHITDHKMLGLINKKAKRVFMSTGMSTLEEIDHAVKIMDRVELYLLHCVSEYPLPEERVNMRVMSTLRRRYGCRVGYSDHTKGILAPLTAVAMGADVIEKHITQSKTYPGTDHILSADTDELKTLVEFTRKIEKILGEEKKQITEIESKNQKFLRNRFSYSKK